MFTVYGQIVIKWRLMDKGNMPLDGVQKLLFFCKILLDPFVLSGLGAAFIASLFWMAAMTKLEISIAYPFTSLAFILVLLISALIFHEPMTIGKVLGLILICSGIYVTVRF
jgi:drug/metabolite transporter (DMT)-like permease